MEGKSDVGSFKILAQRNSTLTIHQFQNFTNRAVEITKDFTHSQGVRKGWAMNFTQMAIIVVFVKSTINSQINQMLHISSLLQVTIPRQQFKVKFYDGFNKY
jgi:hypothetical protein